MNKVIPTRRNRKTEGGARDNTRGLGCGKALTAGPAPVGPVLLWTWVLVLALLAAATPAQADLPALPALPSGQTVQPADILWEDEGGQSALVLRFLAPQIARAAGQFDYDQAEPDMAALCQHLGLAVRAATGPTDTIVVVLMDRFVPRGIPDPDATQFIAAYTVENDRCIWELF